MYPIQPIITGCCALSPSKKNPKTKHPCVKFAFWDDPLPPPPAVTGYITVAHGRSSSVSSDGTAVWYPIIRTLYLSPKPIGSPSVGALVGAGNPGMLAFHVFSSAIWPIHQMNPSLPTKWFLNSPWSNIICLQMNLLPKRD